MANRAVFIDRDGTINEEVGYVNHIGRFWLLPRVGEAIRLLNQHEFKTVVVTNQSGAARGYFVETLIHEVHQKMKTLLSQEGAHLDGVFYCPHHPDQKCHCRKPETGLIEEAAEGTGHRLLSQLHGRGPQGGYRVRRQGRCKRDSRPDGLWARGVGKLRGRLERKALLCRRRSL